MRLEDQTSEELFEAILAVKNLEEAKMFFRDLLTATEIQEFANRWKAARMLDMGETYKDIQKETGLSSTTVARISKWLESGMDGYKLILNRTQHHGDSPETS